MNSIIVPKLKDFKNIGSLIYFKCSQTFGKLGLQERYNGPRNLDRLQSYI